MFTITVTPGDGSAPADLPADRLVAFLTDPRLNAASTDCDALWVEHGLPGSLEYAWGCKPLLVQWSGGRGWEPSVEGQALVALFTRVSRTAPADEQWRLVFEERKLSYRGVGAEPGGQLTPVTLDHAGVAAATAALAGRGWKIARFSLADMFGEPLNASHEEAYRQVLLADLTAGGETQVLTTLRTELAGIQITGIHATKMWGQATNYCHLHTNGVFHSDAPDDVIAALSTATIPVGAPVPGLALSWAR